MDDRFLRIYMNDQLAAGVVWREVARRSQRNNQGTEVGEALPGFPMSTSTGSSSEPTGNATSSSHSVPRRVARS